jgi:guanylate kinase
MLILWKLHRKEDVMSELIVTITGSSGAGKSTLESKLSQYYGGGRVITIATRPPRDSEIPGVHYHFETTKTLDSRNDLLWKVTIHGSIYSVSEDAFFKALKETGGIAFVSITPERHQFVRDWFAPKGIKTLAIHLLPPTETVLRARLMNRGESPGMIQKRLMDSTKFEKNSQSVIGLNFIEPKGVDETFAEVLKLIKTIQNAL